MSGGLSMPSTRQVCLGPGRTWKTATPASSDVDLAIAGKAEEVLNRVEEILAAG